MRPWIKMHTTLLDDVRVLKLNERQQLRYMQSYLLAGRLNADGAFIENGERLTLEDIAIKLRINDRRQFVNDFNAMKKAGLIKANGHGPYIAAFSTEQVDWSKKQDQDRERQARKRGHDNVTRDDDVTDGKSRDGHGDVTPLDQDQTKTKKKIKKETKTKKKIKTTTNQPSSSTSSPARKARRTPLGGGGGVDESKAESKNIEQLFQHDANAMRVVRTMQPILTASGLGSKRFRNLMVKVNTRIEAGDAMKLTLAALASAYDDKTADNKPMVAAYRIEENQIPAQYFNPAKWDSIPEEVLKAAGIDHLSSYVADNGRGLQSKVASLRNRANGRSSIGE